MPLFKAEPRGKFARLSEAALKNGSAFSENRSRALAYLKLLDCDRMLYNFRKAFGADTSAEPLGGWEEPSGLLRGHSTGHFLSALALAYSATGDIVYKSKIDYMVSSLLSLQQLSKGKASEFVTLASPGDAGEDKWSRDPSVWGEGYLGAYPPDQFALLEKFTKYNEIWAPYYTLHKILAGLLDCYDRAGNSGALKCAAGIGNWIYDRLSPLSEEHRKKMWSMYIAGEFGGMNEALTRLYNITGDEKYLHTAQMFDNENIFPGLSEGKDVIQNLHANQHIPQVLGAIEEYKATGNDFYRSVGVNFFDIVTKNHMYSIGGVGREERFRDAGLLAANIKGASNCETCAAYNLLKTARALYALDPENVSYMDYYERALINQILASQTPFVTNTVHNGVTYMLPIGPGEKKEYSDDYHSFTCCHGTGMENHVKYQDASFFERDDGAIIVSQYIPAVYDKGVRIDISIPFPFGSGKITVSGAEDREVLFRIPAWTENPFSFCGAPLKSKRRFAILSHEGGKTETVDVNFKYSVRFEYTPDEINGKRLASVLYGPFVMVAESDEKDFLTIDKNLIPSEDEIKLTGSSLTFIPMYRMHGKAYHTYFYIK